MKMSLLTNEIEIYQNYVCSIVLMAFFRVMKSLENADTFQNDLNVLCLMLKNEEI